MTITLSNLPEDLERFLRAKVAEGGYGSAEEYIKALLQKEAASGSPEAGQNAAPQESEEELRRRVQRFHEEMERAGLLILPKQPPAEGQAENRKLVAIKGPPLSETVINERR
jgi:Arc/MetJ-type ribon-helix-helix transcriptional regulator